MKKPNERPLDVYEQWMVKSNLAYIKREGEGHENVIAQLRENGYSRVAQAVEKALTDSSKTSPR